MMKREFSNREKILLLILVVMILGLLYYVAVYQKIAVNVSAAEGQAQTIQTELAVETAKLQNMTNMQTELDSIRANVDVAMASVPDYDNIQLLMKELNQILSAAINYNITFSNIDFTEGLARRPVNMTFTAGSYATAKVILSNLVNCKYRSILGSISVAAKSGTLGLSQTTVRLDITFYEMYKTE